MQKTLVFVTLIRFHCPSRRPNSFIVDSFESLFVAPALEFQLISALSSIIVVLFQYSYAKTLCNPLISVPDAPTRVHR